MTWGNLQSQELNESLRKPNWLAQDLYSFLTKRAQQLCISVARKNMKFPNKMSKHIRFTCNNIVSNRKLVSQNFSLLTAIKICLQRVTNKNRFRRWLLFFSMNINPTLKIWICSKLQEISVKFVGRQTLCQIFNRSVFRCKAWNPKNWKLTIESLREIYH